MVSAEKETSYIKEEKGLEKNNCEISKEIGKISNLLQVLISTLLVNYN